MKNIVIKTSREIFLSEDISIDRGNKKYWILVKDILKWIEKNKNNNFEDFLSNKKRWYLTKNIKHLILGVGMVRVSVLGKEQQISEQLKEDIICPFRNGKQFIDIKAIQEHYLYKQKVKEIFGKPFPDGLDDEAFKKLDKWVDDRLKELGVENG